MTVSAPQLSFREVLRIPAVRRLWMAQLISVFGDFLAVFAVFGIVTFQMHGTPTQVSMILVAYLLPVGLISPMAGVFVDKWNVKVTMVVSDLARAVLVIILLLAHDLYSIYAAIFLLSVVSSFFLPAQSVALRAVTPTAGLMAANGLMQQAVQGSQLIAPAAAGLVVNWLGATPALGLTSSASSAPLPW